MHVCQLRAGLWSAVLRQSGIESEDLARIDVTCAWQARASSATMRTLIFIDYNILRLECSKMEL